MRSGQIFPMNTFKDEYPTLRAEILQWQSFRFVVLGATTALGTAISAVSNSHDWLFQVNALLLFVALAALLSFFASRGNVMLGEYLRRFHEPHEGVPELEFYTFGWETRRRQFGQYAGWSWGLSLPRILALFYVLIGTAFSFLIFSRSHEKALIESVSRFDYARLCHEPGLIITLLIVAIWLGMTAILFTCGTPNKECREYWQKVEEFERGAVEKKSATQLIVPEDQQSDLLKSGENAAPSDTKA